jgi:hypothetical protein
MLWIRKDIEAEQVPVQCADLTAALLHFPDHTILIISTYVEGNNNPQALRDILRKAQQLVQETRNGSGTPTDVILAVRL